MLAGGNVGPKGSGNEATCTEMEGGSRRGGGSGWLLRQEYSIIC
jgi:hypothetical protein